MTKETKAKWSAITGDYLKMYDAGEIAKLPYQIQSLLYRMASEMQEAICADSRAKIKALETRRDNAYWGTR